MTARFLLATATTALALAGQAQADQHSTLAPANADHIRVVKYSATKRTTVTGLVGQPTTITFPAAEAVYHIVQSQKPATDGQLHDAGWKEPDPKDVEKAPLGNNITLWPEKPGTSIMTVITVQAPCRDPSHVETCVQKPYAFTLVANADPTGKPDDPDATFNVIFQGNDGIRIPHDGVTPVTPVSAHEDAGSETIATEVPRGALRKKRQTAEQKNRDALALDRIRTDAFNASGCHYHAKGLTPNPLTPMCPMDNGRWTLFHFHPGPLPTIYAVERDGSTRWVRQHGDANGGYVFVEEVGPRWRILLTPDVLDIINDNPYPAASPTGTGTIAPPPVKRQILKAASK